jgi:pimeloyl-ACP methyl ester carboxylesterase
LNKEMEITMSGAIPGNTIYTCVEHGYADNNGVKIHYASLGSGPLILMIHGFPDFWYTWRYQMAALSEHYQVVAIDQRGYNLSDKPKGSENYRLSHLVSDVTAVIRHLGREQAIIMGHDWGGAVSWRFALSHPELTQKLIILNIPHPRGLARELAHNLQQQQNSEYARKFQQEDSYKLLTVERLSSWVTDQEAKEHYKEAFQRSDFEAMMSYYQQNYPRPPYQEDASPLVKVQCSVLQIHALADHALLPGALNDTWMWIERDYTLTTLPGVGHFVQAEAADFVTRTITNWLAR